MLLDLHTHTQYSYDAEPGTVEENVCAAIARGISILGITEHVDFFRKAEHILADVEAERVDIERCREKYRGQISILAGVEIGQPHGNPEAARKFLSEHRFDYLIGSLHAMPNDIDLYFHEYEKLDCDAVLQEYFDEVERMLDFGGFQILGHIDYPLRVMKLPDNHPTFAGFMDRVEPILQTLIDRGIALESNAKSLMGWQKQVGPEDFVLERYREMGGELLTVGSDSHSPKTMGNGIEQAMERLRAIGFRHVYTFEQKKPVAIPLGE
ncbi:MAG: histidinol-phosphatase HisJ family protein [Eubacteriales bacterium]|nr:histidinol-phosphatase HisJ family protein [Eubacteriales bacterium]